MADDKLCSEIIWQTLEDFQRISNDIKLRKESQDCTNAYVTTDSFPGYSDDSDSYSCESDTPEKFFTIEKYSKYTGAVIRQYVNPNSPEHSSPNSKHKCDFQFNNLGSEVESVNSKPTSVVSAKLRPEKKQNISHDYGGAKNKQRPKCDSSSDDDRHHLSRTGNESKYEGKFSVNRPKLKNMATAIHEEECTSGSRWKMENDMLNDSKIVTENPEDTISERRKVDSTAENKGKSELQNRGAYTLNRERKSCPMGTDMVMKVASFKETSVDQNCIRRGNKKESDSVKKRLSQLNKKRTHKNNLTIKHYFQTKNTKHVSLFGSSEESVETPHISSTDDCVPGTPIHTTQFGIQLISKTENLSVESPVSLGHYVREPKCSVRIQQTKSEPVDYDTDKSSSEAKLTGYSKHTKKKRCSKLSARTKRANRDIPSYSGSQMGKRDRGSSLQNFYHQQLKSAVQAINEGEHFLSSSEESEKRAAISEDLLLCGAEQKELKIVPDVSLKTSDNFETNHGQEAVTNDDNTETIPKQAVTSSNNQEDFKVSHLTLEQLEQKFKSNVKYLYGILKGEKYCWRHEQFKKGGTDSRNLCYAVSTIPYTDSQLNHLLLLIRNTFYRKYSYMNHFDYIMKVLLPEATTKIFMDQFSLSHEETLQKIHKIHIASDTPDEKSLPW